MKALTKKGNMDGLQTFITGIIGVTVILAVGFIILIETRGSIACTADYSWNETSQTCTLDTNSSIELNASSGAPAAIDSIVTSLGTVPNWIGIIIVVALASIVLAYFYVRN